MKTPPDPAQNSLSKHKKQITQKRIGKKGACSPKLFQY